MRPYTLSRKKSRLSLTLQCILPSCFHAPGCQRSEEKVPRALPGGDGRTRTGDILLAKQALYQLSYAPKRGLVGLTGIEPVTSSLSGTRSNQLSYKPGFARKGRGTLRRETLVRFNISSFADLAVRLRRILLRKEVIQPLVPQRLPCYDFIPITTHTLG